MLYSKDIEKALFETARNLTDPAATSAFLDQACGGNAVLRSRVESLLSVQDSAEKFLASPVNVAELATPPEVAVAVPHVTGDDDSPALEGASARIGRYKLLQRLGEGGCGVVYMAEQEEPVKRRVALKIIRLGMDTEKVVARFEAERQALALMDHPNIARVLDAGATDTGRPYFVMELVRGTKITAFCNEKQLDTRARLGLFIQVCHAIQHAHQKGVIHRDIKPSNILVTLHDGVPVPKVIDFGIAKAIEGKLTDNTLFTAFEQFLGTPAYMSPEQAEMSGLDVDTRSDIYSLGVLLFELITGRTPFDTKKLLQSGVDEIRRTLREREPQMPSVCLTTLDNAELSSIASERHAEPPKLISAVRGDLDWIVMKSLEKDRRRRYETANGLAMDVQRYLNNEPIVARPPSRLYRMQKLARRNKITFLAIGVVAVSLTVASTVSTVLFLREREARQRAVAAEQQEMRLRQEAERLRKAAEDRQKLSEAMEYFTRGRIEDADDLLDEIDTPKPSLEYAALYRAAGEWHIAGGRWRKAADRFAALVQVNQPEDWDSGTLDCLRNAPLLIELGEVGEYERFRKATIARHAGTENPLAAERVLMASLLRPTDENMLRQLEPFGEVAGKSLEISSEKPELDAAAWRALALALLEYRRGNFRQALDWGDRSLDYQNEVLARVASVQLVLAMAHIKLGQGDQAGSEISKCRSVIDATFARGLTVDRKWDGYWFDWVVARILLTEATTLSSEAEAKPKPKRR
jgi:serine/threonine protein kinase